MTQQNHTAPATLHRFAFDKSKPAEKAAWLELKNRLRAERTAGRRGHCHEVHHENPPPLVNDSRPVVLELGCMFENQWNTAPEAAGTNGLRLFDFYVFHELTAKNYRRGHWLELSPEAIAARQQTLKCGYCGEHYGPHHKPAPASGFCDACLDSPYLQKKDLPLIRLFPLSPERQGDAPPMTAAELAEIMPRYIARQTTGADSRAAQKRAKERADILEKYEKTTAGATTERDGLLWLWNAGWPLENWIYYRHTDCFCLGWRSPVSEEVKNEWLKIASEFPFNYEVKSTAGNVDRRND